LGIIDVYCKAGYTRSIRVRDWVNAVLADWADAATLTRGRVFRRLNKARLRHAPGGGLYQIRFLLVMSGSRRLKRALACKQQIRSRVNDRTASSLPADGLAGPKHLTSCQLSGRNRGQGTRGGLPTDGTTLARDIQNPIRSQSSVES
jgi:hypothetical protein